MERQVPLAYAAALLASLLFGWAIVPSHGGYSDPAMTFVVLGSLVVGWRYVADFKGRLQTVPVRLLAPLTLVGAAAMAMWALRDPALLLYATNGWAPVRWVQGGLLVGLLTYLPSSIKLREPRWLRHLRFGAIACCIAIAGVETYVTSPAPDIDVWTVQQSGASALLEGKNPFQEVAVGDTGPRTADDVPYVYPPLQLYLTAPAWLLTRDTRYTMLVAVLLLGFALRAVARRFGADGLPPILEDAPALFVWCSPKLFFILEQGWIDPVQIAWVSALVLAAAFNRPWLTAMLAGLVTGAKQTMLIVAGLYGLGLRFSWKQWAVAGGVAGATFFPWMLWDFGAWKHANFDFVSALPVREDALTYITWVQRKSGFRIPYQLAFPCSAAVIGLAAWKGPRTIGRLTMAVVASMTVFFVINKWAFANYYFTLLGLSALAAAASLDRLAPPPEGDVRSAAPPP